MTGNRPTLSGAEEPRRASKELQKRGDGCVKVYHLLSQLDDVSGYLDASEAATRLGQNGAGCCNELTRQLIVDRAADLLGRVSPACRSGRELEMTPPAKAGLLSLAPRLSWA